MSRVEKEKKRHVPILSATGALLGARDSLLTSHPPYNGGWLVSGK